MSDPAPSEGLEPYLLDRLLDDDRAVGEVTIRLDPERLSAHGLMADDVFLAIQRLGWVGDGHGDDLLGRFHVPAAEANPVRCRAAELLVAGRRISLEQLASIDVRLIPNRHTEDASQRRMAGRRLREAILRDVDWLLNTLSLEASQDLAAFPEVRRSVVNFGLRSLAGRALKSIDPEAAAQRLEAALADFEPRLSSVVVHAARSEGIAGENELRFEIEAQMWGVSSPQRLAFDARIDVDTGGVKLKDRS